jgi:hypothetical protein
MKKLFAHLVTCFRRAGAMLAPPPHRPSSQCGNINALLLHLCDFDYDLHMWVLRWLAYPLRNPGAKMSTCILMNGGHGAGKSMFFDDVMAEIYGDDARALNPVRLQPTLLQWTAGARFVIIDGRYSDVALGHLKHLVSDSAVYAVARARTYEGDRVKRVATLQPNHMNFAFLTGAIDFLHPGVGDRRFVAIEVPPPQQRRFYEAARYEIDNGGVEAFREYLMSGLDMANFTTTTPAPVARVRSAA